ncbi:hypothetical protein LPJ64_002121 [Coemansia asiatica]|uniref:Uncharacterized protein n=1 Tax=Coemansia asiatica TaxID=1052880 RepID=A0A9W8CL88_9FUNG|nr:hypothetical protein LPJ64_002121 [Coemansia asiatica]
MVATSPLEYLKKVRSQKIVLGTMDLSEFGILVDGLYFYKNEHFTSHFMPLDLLVRSFCRIAVDHYPILLGRPTINKAGKGVISVDPLNLCLPDFADMFVDHPAEMFFETLPGTLKDSSEVLFFNTRKFYQTSGVGRLPKASYHRDNASSIIRILRFKDSQYVALSFSFSHVMFDGIGGISFMNHWAEYTRNLDAVENGTYRLSEPPINDRRVMERCFEGVDPIEPLYIKHFKETLRPSLTMGMSKDIAPVLMATPDVAIIEEHHLMHFTAASLERLRQDIDKDETTNIALAALMTKSIVLANQRTFGTLPENSYMVIPYDSRVRSGIPKQYAGNASFAAIAPLSPQKIVDEPYKMLVQAIKEHVSKMEISHTKAALLTIENNLGLLYQASFALCNSPASSYLCITSMRYMPIQSIDFGYGKPCITAMDYFFKEGMAHLLANQQDGGVDLYLNYSDKNFKALCQLKDIKKYANIIY